MTEPRAPSQGEIVTYVVLLLVLAPPLVLLFLSMKLMPQLVTLGVLALHAILDVVLRGSAARRCVAVPLVLLFFLGALVALCIQALLWISPPVTADGHPVMAVGQVFLGALFGLVGAALLGYFYFKRLRSARLEPILLHAIGAALLVAFLVDRL